MLSDMLKDMPSDKSYFMKLHFLRETSDFISMH